MVGRMTTHGEERRVAGRKHDRLRDKRFAGSPQADQGGGRRRWGRGAVWRHGLQSDDVRGAGRGGRQVGKAAQGRVLQRRTAGDLVRAGQAGGRILGQAVQRRRDLVRRPARRGQAARRDRQHGLAEVGFRRHPGVRHRHPDRAGQQDDRRRHSGHRHGHADRAARHDQRAHLPRARQRVHGRVGHPGAGQRDQRRRHDRDDPGRARPHRRARARARASSRSSRNSRRSRCSTSSRPTGT